MVKYAMINTYHGHEVMHMMVASGKQYSRVSLIEEIKATFGKEARFFTCSANDMSAEDLVDFLEARGKFVSLPNGFNTDPQKICKH